MAETQQAEPEPAAPPAPSDQDNLIAQYDAEAESLPSSPEVAPEGSHAPPLARTLPERGPDGKFLPRQEEARKPSPAMIQMAQDLGLTPDEIASTPADALEVAVYHISRQQRRQQEVHQARQSAVEQDRNQAFDRNLGNQGGGSPASGPSPTSPSAAQPEAAVPEDKPYNLGLQEDQYDPALMGALKKLAAAHADQSKELKSLKQQVAHLHHVENIRANESFAQKMDRLFSGDEATFGKGEGRELKEDGPELARRRAVLGVMQGIKAGTIEQKYEKAYQMLYGSVKPAAPASDDADLAARQDEWRRGNVARPTQRAGGSEPPGTAKATRSVAAKMAEQNGAIDSGEADESDFLG